MDGSCQETFLDQKERNNIPNENKIIKDNYHIIKKNHIESNSSTRNKITFGRKEYFMPKKQYREPKKMKDCLQK